MRPNPCLLNASFHTVSTAPGSDFMTHSATFNESAEQADRALATGDGEAEPVVIALIQSEPAKLATDGSREESVAPWALLVTSFGSPGSAAPSPGATLCPPASQAR